jgi:hypothetical protein
MTLDISFQAPTDRAAAMLAAPNTNAAGLDRALRRLLDGAGLSFVAGTEGWASVPYALDRSRDVVLFWTSNRQATYWADAVAAEPQVYDVGLGRLLHEILPMLADHGCLVGLDWSDDPADPVMEPTVLADRIWQRRNLTFLDAVIETNTIWMLHDAAGPAIVRSQRWEDRHSLPVWSSREAAQAAATTGFAGKTPLGVTLAAFDERYMPYLEKRGFALAPSPIDGAAVTEMSPGEFLDMAATILDARDDAPDAEPRIAMAG